MDKTVSFRKLFLSTLSISAFTFGGGFVIVSLMRKKFVEEFKWLEENEMIDIASLAQSSPGAIAVNASILVGYRLLGIPGVLVSILGTVIPPLFIITIITYFYQAFLGNLIFKYLLAGMKAGVAAVVIDAALSMMKTVLGDKDRFRIVVAAVAFIMVCFLKVNAAIVILLCGTAGIINGKLSKRRDV